MKRIFLTVCVLLSALLSTLSISCSYFCSCLTAACCNGNALNVSRTV